MDGSEWIPLKTELKSSDKEYTYYQARADAFGPFAVVGVVESGEITQTIPRQEIQSGATVTPTPVPTSTHPDTVTGILPGILGLALPVGEETLNIWLLFLMSIAVALLYILRRKIYA